MTPKPKNKKHAWIAFVLFTMLYLCILYVLLFVVPVFAEMYADFGAELPKPSQYLIDVSNVLKFNLIIWPVALVPVAFGAWLVEGPVGRKAIPILWVMFALALLNLVVIVGSLFLPISQLNSMVQDTQSTTSESK